MKLLLHVDNERKITHFSEKKSFTMAFQVNAQAENKTIPVNSFSLTCLFRLTRKLKTKKLFPLNTFNVNIF